MGVDVNTDKAAAELDMLWGLATVEVIEAQLAYAEVASTSDDNDAEVAAAWLRLWRAEERQRQVSTQFDP